MIQKKQKKKRPTQPKIKGCYECSQRRISCDRAEPECGKCVSRNLRCSGLGVRYRFEVGVASRGKFVGMTARDICEVDPKQQTEDRATHIVNVVVVDDLKPSPGLIYHNRDGSVRPASQSSSITAYEPLGEDPWHLTNSESPEQTAEVSDRLAFGPGTRPYNVTCLRLDRFETVPQWKRSFITYFSRRIAPYMLSIDDESNGWRELILPIALDDEVVMDAVITASAYHISANSDTVLSLGPLSYTKAINGLMKRQDFRRLKPLVNGFSIIAILVLLCSVLVSGCDDFPIMFKMLKSAYEVMMEDGGSGDHTLNDFLRRQVNKIRTYGEPMISEKSGIEAVSTRALESFDCLRHCMLRHPEHLRSLRNVKSQIEQAYHIYLRRALGDLDQEVSIQLVEHFKSTAETYPGTAPGHHVLIWATFMVACESSTEEHRHFLVEQLRLFHRISKFENNLKAIDLLKSVWSNAPDSRWTTTLPEMRTLIM